MAKKHIAIDQLGEQYQNETTKLLGKTLTRIIHDGGSRIAGPHCEACAKLVRIGYPLAQMGEDTHGVVASPAEGCRSLPE
jgi:hypothetical protein